MMLSYVPQFELMNPMKYNRNGTILKFTIPPFIRETVNPPLPSVMFLRMIDHNYGDGMYRFAVNLTTRLGYQVNENWLRDFASHSMQSTEKEILNPAFTFGENTDGLSLIHI